MERDEEPRGGIDALTGALGGLVAQAVGRAIDSPVPVTSAAEGKRLLSVDDGGEALADGIQRVVALATPVTRALAKGARFTKMPWALVASSTVSIGVSVKTGIRELQVIAGLLAYRLELETAAAPDPQLLQKLALELYLDPVHVPDITNGRLPLIRLIRRWAVAGALGRDTRAAAGRSLDSAERLDLARLAATWSSRRPA